MTAAHLNFLYDCYVVAPGHLNLGELLEGVRKYAIAKFYRDLDKEDIAQECVKQVWRSVDPNCTKPLKHFAQDSSFSTWVSKTCTTTRSNFIRDQGQHEEPMEDEGLERLSNKDPWHSDGRRKVGPLPTEGYYYEKPDPNCKIPLGKSAWEE